MMPPPPLTLLDRIVPPPPWVPSEIRYITTPPPVGREGMVWIPIPVQKKINSNWKSSHRLMHHRASEAGHLAIINAVSDFRC